MVQLDVSTRRRVISWALTVVDIVRKLEEENCITSKKNFSVSIKIMIYQEGQEKSCYIDKVLSQDDETKCVQLHHLLHEWVNVSLATV